jgi:RNA polymerase sigma factor (sigma-70 family)
MAQFEKFTEAEIIARILDGEKALYEIIVRRINPYLYKVGRSYNYNHEDTQDLMQDTLLDAYNNLKQFEGRSSFKTWIIRIMMNNCYRKKEKPSFKNEIIQDINDNSKPMFVTTSNDTDKIVQNRELNRIIENALGKIPFNYRMVFSLREVNELNVAETASLLSISEANVKVRLSRAKIMLRSEIEKMFTASELYEFNLKYCDSIVANVMKKIGEQ